jgi:hypothetical protein
VQQLKRLSFFSSWYNELISAIFVALRVLKSVSLSVMNLS